MPTRPHYTAKLLNSVTLSERAQCKHLEFEVQELDSFEFIAGQFISTVAKGGEKMITRAYSIASGPRNNKRFDLCLNRVENGFFSNYLCDMKEGDSVQFHGPHGHFVLRNPLRDCIMIATGTGIAPMRGFVEWLFPKDGAPRNHGRKIYLVYGTRLPSELYYGDYFQSVADQHPDFRYITTLSRAEESWTGKRGYVQDRVKEILDARSGNGKEDMDAYICGLNLMVSANRELLAGYGWDKKQIVFERYD